MSLPRAEDLPPRWREMYEERAAIREFDGMEDRETAEREAMKEVIDIMGRWRDV